jgi:hypothetical protein
MGSSLRWRETIEGLLQHGDKDRRTFRSQYLFQQSHMDGCCGLKGGGRARCRFGRMAGASIVAFFFHAVEYGRQLLRCFFTRESLSQPHDDDCYLFRCGISSRRSNMVWSCGGARRGRASGSFTSKIGVLSALVSYRKPLNSLNMRSSFLLEGRWKAGGGIRRPALEDRVIRCGISFERLNMVSCCSVARRRRGCRSFTMRIDVLWYCTTVGSRLLAECV